MNASSGDGLQGVDWTDARDTHAHDAAGECAGAGGRAQWWRQMWPKLCHGLDDHHLHRLADETQAAAAAGWVDSYEHLLLRADVLRGLDDDTYLQRLTELPARHRQPRADPPASPAES